MDTDAIQETAPPAEPLAAPETPEPEAPAGQYLYDGQDVTYHPILGAFMPGVNDLAWAEAQYPEILADLLQTGTLRKA